MCERRPQRQGKSAKQPAELTIIVYNCLYCELIEFITLVCVYDIYFCYIDFLQIWLYFELAIFSKRFCFPGRSPTCGHPRHIRCHMPLCAQCFGAAHCARPTKNVRNRADRWNISGTSWRSPKLERKELVGSSCVIGIWGLLMFTNVRQEHLHQKINASLYSSGVSDVASSGSCAKPMRRDTVLQVAFSRKAIRKLSMWCNQSHSPTEALSWEVRTAFMPMEKWTPQCHLHFFQKLFQQRILAKFSPSFCQVERCNFALQMGSTKPSLVPREVPRSLVDYL